MTCRTEQTHTRSFAYLTAALGTIVTLHACGGEDTPITPPQPEPSRPTTISIEPDTFFVTAGATVSLKSAVEDQRGRLMFNVPLTWASSDPAVATVDTAGVVTGIREGKAAVTVTAGPVSTTAAGTVHSQDRRTLMDLRRLAGGGSWTNEENWGSNEPVGSWYGVEANADARVTALRLSDNGLTGQLPENLGELAFLTELHLDGNDRLSGPIPSSLTALGIQELQYGGTMLCTVRDEGFRAWLNAIPTRDGDFLACNEERADLMTLYHAMGGAGWASSVNWGTSAPLDSWFGINVDSAGRVREINLSRNDLSGTVPPEIQYFPHLRLLRLDYNDLVGEVPPEIGKLTELRRIDIDGNNFTGRIPPEIGDLANLEILWMGGNDMSGPIPPELGNLANLWELHLYEAAFEGPIPSELGGLAELRRLDLRDNRIDGPIPAWLGELEHLTRLRIYDNQLSGPLPPQLGQLDNLEMLWVGGNMLSGPLPPKFAELESLRWLQLQNNPGLSGPLPGGLTSMLALRELVAFETGLCAPVEPEFRTWLNDVVTKSRVRSCEELASYYTHLIQSVQSTRYPVPLVAGRSALLRVFVIGDQETTETIPPVRATFFVNGTEVHAVDIPAGTSAIPRLKYLSDLERTSNAEIPADVIQPGLEMVVEIDPNETVDQALGVAKRIPAEGRLAVEVKVVPPLYLTLIPFITNDNNREAVTFVAEATPDHDLFSVARTLLPLDAFELRKHSSVTIGSNVLRDVLAEVRRIRAIEQGTGHWKGLIVNTARGGGIAGFGNDTIPSRGKTSVSRLNAETIAHELGHNFNLRHADCGNAPGVDRSFPYPEARVGVWGYDPRDGGSIVSSSRADFMSYCDPTWISDYYFTNALRFRVADTLEVRGSSDQRTLLVSGGTSADGALHLDPTFLIETSPIVPHFPGPYQMTGRRADGSELFSLSFGMEEIMDGDGHSGFTFALPVEAAWEVELASLVLSGPDGSVEMRHGSEPAMAIMRDPTTGEVRAILHDLPAGALSPGALDGLAPEPGLDIMVSDGLPSLIAWRR